MIDTINNSFGTNFRMAKAGRIKGLPLYMTAGRSFYQVEDDAYRFLLIKVPSDDKYGIVALDKQRTQYEEKSGLNVAYWFEQLSRYQRDSLISHRIPFVADEMQLYLPFLGIAIQNSFKKKSMVKVDKMMPITQSLFLYLLYMCNGQKVMKKQAAEFLTVTKTSITRASEQLERMGLICQQMSGKEYYMWTELGGYELFLKAKDYMINPVQETFVTEASALLSEMPESGESALATRSMLNPSKMGNIAMDKALARKYAFEHIDERWEEDKKLVKLELWKYDPVKFSKDGVVDPVSLYMTFADTKDERIEGALEEMMEGYNW